MFFLPNKLILIMGTLVASGFGSWVVAQDPTPSPFTSIVVPKMDCASCAKKMATQLRKVPGVAEVAVNMKTTTMVIRPADGAAPSPRALWEAIVRAGFQPTQMEGPGGVFTSKPPS